MNETQATAIADAFNMDDPAAPWRIDHTGGNIWVVSAERADGKCIVISEECICEYESADAFQDGQPDINVIYFQS